MKDETGTTELGSIFHFKKEEHRSDPGGKQEA
jgi:hypothetical protein